MADQQHLRRTHAGEPDAAAADQARLRARVSVAQPVLLSGRTGDNNARPRPGLHSRAGRQQGIRGLVQTLLNRRCSAARLALRGRAGRRFLLARSCSALRSSAGSRPWWTSAVPRRRRARHSGSGWQRSSYLSLDAFAVPGRGREPDPVGRAQGERSARSTPSPRPTPLGAPRSAGPALLPDAGQSGSGRPWRRLRAQTLADRIGPVAEGPRGPDVHRRWRYRRRHVGSAVLAGCRGKTPLPDAAGGPRRPGGHRRPADPRARR